MNTDITNIKKDLKWRFPNGDLVKITDLSAEELSKARKISAQKVNDYLRNYEFFSELLEAMDNEVKNRLSNLELQLEHLKKIEEEI